MRNIQLVSGLPFELPPIEDIVDALPSHPSKTYRIRRPDEIKNIIIHHTAHYTNPLNHARYHVNQRGWARIGYHILISDGKILQVNDLNSESWHCAGWNHNSIGISINADLSKREMTDQERILLHAAILTVKSLYKIEQILGHNEASKLVNKPGTSCPCTPVQRIREEVSALEETLNYQETNGEKAKVDEMIRRISDLYTKYQDKNNPYQAEATRKLAVIHQVLTDMKWF